MKRYFKRGFLIAAMFFVAAIYTGAHFSDSVSVSGNTFTAGMWATPPAPEAESIIITEFMADPAAVSDTNGEWFEIYNPTSNSINLNGWRYCDDDCSESKIIDSDLIITSHSYLVFAKNIDVSTNGGVNVDFQIGNLSLTNTDDSIIFYKPDGLGKFVLIDRVDYSKSAGWPISAGKSAMLNDLAADNSIMSNWLLSTSTYGSGDYGTPGGPNGL
jgi:uncharacterized protein